jgi:hypothetical protein
MQSELEDASLREGFKRQRQQKAAVMKATGKTDCDACLDECCCGGSGCCTSLTPNLHNGGGYGVDIHGGGGDGCDCAFFQLLLYIVFPAFAIVDFLLGFVARSQDWYDASIGQLVCTWSLTACAVWIALGICGFVLFTASIVNAIFACCRYRRRRYMHNSRRNTADRRRMGNNGATSKIPSSVIMSAGGGSVMILDSDA